MADASDLDNPADYSDLRDEVLASRAELAALRERAAEAERLLRLWQRWDGEEDSVPSPHADTVEWLHPSAGGGQ